MLELKILSVNVLLPVLMLAGTLWGLRWTKASDAYLKDDASGNESPSSRFPSSRLPSARDKLAATILIVVSVAAVWLAFGLRVEFSLWPEDAWARLPHSFAIVSLGSALAIWISGSSLAANAFAWAIRLGGLVVAAKIVIPTGEAWEFLQPTVNTWWTLLVLCPLVSWCVINRMPSRMASTFGFGTIALIAAAAFLSSEFLRVTEPLLAVASVVGCASIAAWRVHQALPISAVFGPCMLTMGAAVASTQFNSFAGKPDSLSWLAISTPAIAAVLLMMVAGLKRSGSPTWKRLAVSLIVCFCLAAGVVTWTITVGGSASDDEWSFKLEQRDAIGVKA